MDTNLITELILALKQPKPAAGIDGQTIISAITLLAAFGLSLAGLIIAYFTNARAKVTSTDVQAIHTAVNSKSTAIDNQVKQLQDQVASLSAEKAVSAERERGQQLKDAAAVASVALPALTKADVIEILEARIPKPLV